MKRAFSLWGPVASWAGLIFLLSSIPNLKTGLEYDFFLRKAAHLLEFAVLASLLWRALRGAGSFSTTILFALTFSGAVLYAASDEWHQSFVKGRGPSVRDVLIDSAGAWAACWVLKGRIHREMPH